MHAMHMLPALSPSNKKLLMICVFVTTQISLINFSYSCKSRGLSGSIDGYIFASSIILLIASLSKFTFVV